MSNQLQLFTFAEAFPLRIIDIGGNPWFIASDVCTALGLGNTSKACERLDDDEKLVSQLVIAGQNRDVLLINESGLYNLVLTSNKPQAKPFKKWVTGDVLPSIRKTGGYAVSNAPANFADALQLAADQQREIQRQQEQIAMQAPKVDLANAVIADASLMALSEVATELGQKRKAFFEVLVQANWVFKRKQNDGLKEGPWLPFADKQSRGLLVFKKRPDDRGFLRDQTLVTGKGLAEIQKLFA
jgi:anti-repressor protein